MSALTLRRLAPIALAAGAAASLLAGCGANAGLAPRGAAPAIAIRRAGPSASGKITHVVFIMQENRSFDNLFQGYPGADTVAQGPDSKGNIIPLQPISLAAPYDIAHGFKAHIQAFDDGKMDGFNNESTGGDTSGYPNPQYGYVPPVESRLYFEMAHRYVLGDRMFASQLDASFVSHQYMIAAQAAGSVNLPTTAWGCPGGSSDRVQTLTQDRKLGPHQVPCFDYTTLGDELDGAALDWRFYASTADNIWSAYQAVEHIRYGPDWQYIKTPSRQIVTDVEGGYLPAVAWVTPSALNSDHPGVGSATGPQWVAAVVNAIGRSSYWNSTAIFVMWDEWGGWYDHVKPSRLDYDGLGFRVPLLVISPYAKEGYVSHVPYEHGSILRFIEDQFGLGQLAASDARATSPEADCFDFTQQPRKFVPFRTPPSTDSFLGEPAGLEPTDGE